MSDAEKPSSSMGTSRRRSVSESATEPPAIPSDFLCPISLELMSDPVMLSTGHTYDRKSIEKWFSTGKKMCPQSWVEVSPEELIPNLSLRDCILDWQMNMEVPKKKLKYPTSPTLLTDMHVRLLLEDIMVETDNLQTLKALHIMSEVNDRNRKLICQGGALPILGSVLSRTRPEVMNEEAAIAALGALAALSDQEEAKLQLPAIGVSMTRALSYFLRIGELDVRVRVIKIIECMVADDDTLLMLGAEEGLVRGLVDMLQHQEYLDITGILRCLYAICLPRVGKLVAIAVGAVTAVIELIPGAKTEIAEGALALLDLISCKCSEGLLALSEHALVIPIMARSILEYTHSGTEHAVNVLHTILTTNPNLHLQFEAVKAGATAKLLRVISIPDINSATKLKAREILKTLQVTGSDPSIRTTFP
ncbi:hypothetical protein MPTK1_3g22750 [Marchantia polymorpha subsp. ruderalis]|nr:hypothetical protein MARPO_0024s0052 [Marchantia polymorpha]BBN06635.1 hypothetical protein Mp_3g22750 [Marchantia polymorpha subsp. ruderalis]|eukprot:PTQ43534.1 hypothetical protein MARPO_0024s0052 [Marchantia polymorpha]